MNDEALTYCIWELRKALGDDAKKPRYIQTVPKKGYRLIAAVASPTAALLIRTRRGLLAVAAGFVMVVSVVVSYLILPTDSRDPPFEGTLVQLTSEAGLEYFPSLSPDGGFVAYAGETSGNWDIYLLRVGGQKALNLTEDCPEDDTQPAFSPDGGQIAFRSERDGGGIFLMGATGESVTRLTDFGYNPAWSPVGKEIALATEGIVDAWGRFGTSMLWAVNVSSGDKRLITEADAVQPSWSPNGDRIAYWGVPKGSGQREIWTVPSNGGEAVRITDDLFIDWNPVWSPDGRWLAGEVGTVKTRAAERAGIAVYSLESQQYQRLAEYGSHPRWLPDSCRLLFSHKNGIFLVDRESGRVQEILSLSPDEASMPVLSHDDQWLYFIRGTISADIWMFTLNKERE